MSSERMKGDYQLNYGYLSSAVEQFINDMEATLPQKNKIRAAGCKTIKYYSLLDTLKKDLLTTKENLKANTLYIPKKHDNDKVKELKSHVAFLKQIITLHIMYFKKSLPYKKRGPKSNGNRINAMYELILKLEVELNTTNT